ncbi:MAG: hypothetical protein DMF64_16285 [Acidobacteria bacterium]|nr:MAG: hypothetical protein DMF64_16285 [Acidobacteriota bacterium]
MISLVTGALAVAAEAMTEATGSFFLLPFCVRSTVVPNSNAFVPRARAFTGATPARRKRSIAALFFVALFFVATFPLPLADACLAPPLRAALFAAAPFAAPLFLVVIGVSVPFCEMRF